MMILISLFPFVQMSTYSAVKNLFVEQESLQDCIEVVNEADSSLSEPHPLCALAAMFVLAQGLLVCNSFGETFNHLIVAVAYK